MSPFTFFLSFVKYKLNDQSIAQSVLLMIFYIDSTEQTTDMKYDV